MRNYAAPLAICSFVCFCTIAVETVKLSLSHKRLVERTESKEELLRDCNDHLRDLWESYDLLLVEIYQAQERIEYLEALLAKK